MVKGQASGGAESCIQKHSSYFVLKARKSHFRFVFRERSPVEAKEVREEQVGALGLFHSKGECLVRVGRCEEL